MNEDKIRTCDELNVDENKVLDVFRHETCLRLQTFVSHTYKIQPFDNDYFNLGEEGFSW